MGRERLVGTVKRFLRTVLRQSRLTEEQLNTTLIIIEAAVKSRPITQGEDSAALNLSHFLVGEGLTTIPRTRDYSEAEPGQGASIDTKTV